MTLLLNPHDHNKLEGRAFIEREAEGRERSHKALISRRYSRRDRRANRAI